LSGKLPTEECPYHRYEWFLIGTEPTERDPFYRTMTVDRMTGTLAGAGVPPERQSRRLVLDLPPQVHPWARAQGLPLYSDLVRRSDLLRGETRHADSPLRMVAPGDQTVYRLAPELSREMQRLHLQAVADAGLRRVSLWLDGEKLADFSDPPYEVWWALEEGIHLAWAVAISPEGEQVVSETVTFEVQAPPE
jgi:hypothetical protein